MLVDLRPFNVKGNAAAESLSNANITCNKNGIPFDSEKPMITSGIRLGTQAATTRGFGLKEFEKVGDAKPKKVVSKGMILMGVGFLLLTWGAVNVFKDRRG